MISIGDTFQDGSTKWRMRRSGDDGNPVGTIIMYASNIIPPGYLLCDGSAVSRKDYAELFSIIGITWGVGDGVNTFNLPNTIGRFPEGSVVIGGGYIDAGLPRIDLQLSGQGISYDVDDYGFVYSFDSHQNSHYPVPLSISVSSSSLYGKSDTVQPASYPICNLIKYI